MPKCTNAFGGRALPGPAGRAYALPQIPQRQWGGLTSNGREEMGRRKVAEVYF